jgi:protein-tyrosine phosphatase
MSPATSGTGPYDRHLRLPGTRNLRDIGGYPAGPGRQTKWRTLFRTDALDLLPVDSQRALLDIGVRHAIDLRWPGEIEARPSVFRDSADVRYLSLPLHDDRPEPTGGVPASYRAILDGRGSQFAAVGHALLAPGGLPAVIGCTAGIDRTGLTIALILSAIGVPPEIVAADYALSAANYASDGRGSGLDDWRSGPVVVDCIPEYMIGALDHVEATYGGAAAFLASHGLTAADVGRLRDLLTEAGEDAGR